MKINLSKVICLLVLVLMGCNCGGVVVGTPVRDPSSLVKHMEDTTVALVIVDDEIRPYCTGVWLEGNKILTAGHCAEAMARKLMGLEEEEITVDPMNIPMHYIVKQEVDQVGKEPTAIHLGKVVAFDEKHDLAIIQAKGSTIPRHPVAELANELPGIGERIYIMGHPRGLYWSYIEGTISAYREFMPIEGREGPYIQVSAPVWFGNSGGGVFDSDGKLLGIASMLTSAANTALFIHLDSIKELLAREQE